MQLSELYTLCQHHRDRPFVIVDVDEWTDLVERVPLCQVVDATEERPAFFWYQDKKVVTPRYVQVLRSSLDGVVLEKGHAG